MGIVAKIKATAETAAAGVVEKADGVRLARARSKLVSELGQVTYDASKSGEDVAAETGQLIAAIDDLDADHAEVEIVEEEGDPQSS